MTTDDNKALVQQFFEQVINQRNLAALDQFVPPGGVNHIGADLSIRITSVPTANSASAARRAVRSRDARADVGDS